MIEPASPAAIGRAGALLRAGDLVAFPTETVYGLGGDATSDRAVAGIFAAKGRPAFNPLIVHVADIDAAGRLVVFNDLARRLATALWPGALTLVLPRAAGSPVSLLASAGLDTIAVRVPAHDVARSILAAAGVPVAAPSANASGTVSPTRAAHVAESLGAAVALIVDGGACPVGIESTVVDCRGPVPVILRPGGITAERIGEIAGTAPVSADSDPDAPSSPGMLASHYAPAHPLRLDCTAVAADEALLSFGRHALGGAVAERNLSPGGDLREAAANLFAMLRELDRVDCGGIAAMPVPDTGLGRAINDRLRRAAAPRPASPDGPARG